MVTSLGAEEPSLTFQDGATKSTAAKVISLATSPTTVGGTLDQIILASVSGSGTCFYLRHVATAGLATSGSWMATTGTGTDCQAGNAPATGWTAL
jgi:hypothetical protein